MRFSMACMSTCALIGSAVPAHAQASDASAILVNIDGSTTELWAATRWKVVGPDGDLNWDRLPGLADFRFHPKGILTSGSGPSCTAMAYGVNVGFASFGTDRGRPLTALSGKPLSIMEEAKAAGKAVGLVNDANILGAGTAVFLGRASPETMLPLDKEQRGYYSLAEQMLDAQPDLLLGSGEAWFLPQGVQGRHGTGRRKDGRNLIARARDLGYEIVYTRDELKKASLTAPRVLGLFAAEDTFQTGSEEELDERNVPRRVETAPTVPEMLEFALPFLARRPMGFLLAVNSEAADNYATNFNARDALAAMEEGDKAIGVMLRFLERHPRTHVMVLADGAEGGFAAIGWLRPGETFEREKPVPATDPRGTSQIDGRDGTATLPFLAAPDRYGQQHTFAVSWGARAQRAGGIVVRSAGYRAELVRGSMDTTDIYRVLYQVLFGKALPGRK